MKHILQILLLTLTPFICSSQINVSELVLDDTLFEDTFYVDAKMNIQINELHNLITIEYIGINSETKEIEELKIETICKNNGEIIIESPYSTELEYNEPIIIKLNPKSHYVKFDHDDEQLIYKGKGVNIFYSNKRDLDRCIIRD